MLLYLVVLLYIQQLPYTLEINLANECTTELQHNLVSNVVKFDILNCPLPLGKILMVPTFFSS